MGDLSEAERSEVREELSLAEFELFSGASSAEQRHAFGVYRTLQQTEIAQPALLKAALLHDMGKSKAPLTLWQKSLVVLGERFWPEAAERWSQGEARGWRKPFVVRHRHAEWGAQMAEEAGSQELTVMLIRRHQEKRGAAGLPLSEEDQLLRQLQQADELN